MTVSEAQSLVTAIVYLWAVCWVVRTIIRLVK